MYAFWIVYGPLLAAVYIVTMCSNLGREGSHGNHAPLQTMALLEAGARPASEGRWIHPQELVDESV